MASGYGVVSGGTDTHLMLVDLRPKGLTGKEVEEALGRAAITVNKNTVPGDPQSPFVTSGIRVGTPALTTRGMKEAEMRMVGELIHRAIEARANEGAMKKVKDDVRELAEGFPLYGLRKRVLSGRPLWSPFAYLSGRPLWSPSHGAAPTGRAKPRDYWRCSREPARAPSHCESRARSSCAPRVSFRISATPSRRRP